MLRIHVLRLARRHAEERRVEFVRPRDEAAVPRRHLAGRRGIRVVERVDVPAVARHLGYGVDAVAQQRPEFLRRIGAAWETQREADDRDRRVRPAFRRLGAGAQFLDRAQRLAQLLGHRGLGRCGGRRAHSVFSSSSSSPDNSLADSASSLSLAGGGGAGDATVRDAPHNAARAAAAFSAVG